MDSKNYLLQNQVFTIGNVTSDPKLKLFAWKLLLTNFDDSFQIFCDPDKRVKVSSDFCLASGKLMRGENDVELELEDIVKFLEVHVLLISQRFSIDFNQRCHCNHSPLAAMILNTKYF